MGWITGEWKKGERVENFIFGPDAERSAEGYAQYRGLSGRVTQVAARAVSNMNAFYCVMRRGEAGVFGPWEVAVFRVKWWRGRESFGYDYQNEGMGPLEVECPLRVLKVAEQLVPLPVLSEAQQAKVDEIQASVMDDLDRWRALYTVDPDHHARQWRADVYAHHERLAQAKKVKPGDVLKFSSPIKFADGLETDTLVAERSHSGSSIVFVTGQLVTARMKCREAQESRRASA